MDATTDIESLNLVLEKLLDLDPAAAPDLASSLADELAAALDALEEGTDG